MSKVTGSPKILVEISAGELIDKITILEIKESRITDPGKLVNIRFELAELRHTHANTIPMSSKVAEITADLTDVNAALWDIEDAVRNCERNRDFDSSFVDLARSVYRTNDKRSTLKRRQNELLGSQVLEQKSYQKY